MIKFRRRKLRIWINDTDYKDYGCNPPILLFGSLVELEEFVRTRMNYDADFEVTDSGGVIYGLCVGFIVDSDN